jgi:hypothetical protein
LKLKPKRIRSEAYMKTLRGAPCLVCRQGSEAHHITFAEPKAMAMKVGDNWCVPLCHHHHMELHSFGDERTWWDLQGIEPMKWAEVNWKKYNEK